MTGYIHTYGAEMAKNGFPICAIKSGTKRPLGNHWQDNPLTHADCLKYEPSSGVGVILGTGEEKLYGLDADIYEEEFADRFLEEINKRSAGFPFIRYGAKPKFMSLVRMDGPARTKLSSPKFEKDGKTAQFEFLGKGQQAVAYGIHPVTKAPYEWEGVADIHSMKPGNMPVVTTEGLKELFEIFCNIAQELGYKKISDGVDSDAPEDAALLAVLEPPKEPIGLALEEASELLFSSGISNEAYDSWLRVGMALHHEFKDRDPDGALNLWDSWSSTASSYNKEDSVSGKSGREMVEAKWASFGKRASNHSVTIRWVQREWRKNNVEAVFAKELSDRGILYRFLKKYGETIKYVQDTGSWYVYDGNYWASLIESENRKSVAWMLYDIVSTDLPKEAEAYKNTAMHAIVEEISKFVNKRMANCAWTDRVEKLLKGSPSMWARLTDFDKDRDLFGLGNGVLRLSTQEFFAPNPVYMISKHSPILYDIGAECPLWERTVSECLSEDEEKIGYFKRWCGYTLLGYPREGKLHIFEGSGCNGKTMLLNILQKIHGSYCVPMSCSLLTSRRYDEENANGPQPALAGLVGARLALCSEAEQGAKLREAMAKRLTGLDWITARKIYARESIHFQMLAVIVMATNYKPEIAGLDYGIWRRQEFLKFERDFDHDPKLKKDPDRGLKLEREMPGIFNWMLEGLKEYLELGGLRPPKSVADEVEEFKSEMDVVRQWFIDKWEVTGNPKDTVKMSYMWNQWTIYARQCNFVNIVNNQNQMTRRIRSLLEDFEGGSLYRATEGYRLRGVRPKQEEQTPDFELGE